MSREPHLLHTALSRLDALVPGVPWEVSLFFFLPCAYLRSFSCLVSSSLMASAYLLNLNPLCSPIHALCSSPFEWLSSLNGLCSFKPLYFCTCFTFCLQWPSFSLSAWWRTLIYPWRTTQVFDLWNFLHHPCILYTSLWELLPPSIIVVYI